MNRKAYPSDLTNEQWKLLKRILPPPSGRGRKRTVDLREVLNGIFLLVAHGMPMETSATRISGLANCLRLLSALAKERLV